MAQLIQRSIVIAAIGLAAGMAHSAWYQLTSATPVRLTPEAPPPLVIPGFTSPAEATQAGTTPAIATPQPAASADPMAALNITIAQSKALFDAGAPFIDARNIEEYRAGHVAGAFWIPAERFAGGTIPEALQYLDTQNPMVIYCGGGACDASKNVLILLQQAGYKGGRIMHDGYPEWVNAGYAIGTGEPVVGAP